MRSMLREAEACAVCIRENHQQQSEHIASPDYVLMLSRSNFSFSHSIDPRVFSNVYKKKMRQRRHRKSRKKVRRQFYRPRPIFLIMSKAHTFDFHSDFSFHRISSLSPSPTEASDTCALSRTCVLQAKHFATLLYDIELQRDQSQGDSLNSAARFWQNCTSTHPQQKRKRSFFPALAYTECYPITSGEHSAARERDLESAFFFASWVLQSMKLLDEGCEWEGASYCLGWLLLLLS